MGIRFINGWYRRTIASPASTLSMNGRTQSCRNWCDPSLSNLRCEFGGGAHEQQEKDEFTNYNQQSRMVAGVCVPDGDYDELLREAVRIALRTDMNPTHDDWDDLYDRIRGLMDAYIHSPEGAGEDASTLMSRLAACVADVVPLPVRKTLGFRRALE